MTLPTRRGSAGPSMSSQRRVVAATYACDGGGEERSVIFLVHSIHAWILCGLGSQQRLGYCVGWARSRAEQKEVTWAGWIMLGGSSVPSPCLKKAPRIRP